MFGGVNRFLAVFLSTLLVAVGLVSAEAVLAPAAVAAPATTTSDGKYAKQIFWLDWATAKNAAGVALSDAIGDNLLPDASRKQIVDGAYVETEPFPGYRVRATINNILSNHNSAPPANAGLRWPLDISIRNPLQASREDNNYADVRGPVTAGRYPGYSTGTQFSRLTPRRNGLGVRFRITFSVYVNGTLAASEFPDVIASDGENLNPSENIRFTTSGDVWRNVDNVRLNSTGSNIWTSKANCGTTGLVCDNTFAYKQPTLGLEPTILDRVSVTSTSGQGYPALGGFGTKTYGNITSGGLAVPLGMSRDAQHIDVNIQTDGAEDVLIGFIVNTDRGDAPASYGDAAHVLSWDTNHATVQPNSADINNQPAVVLNSAAGPYLGEFPPDAEASPIAPSWTGDDASGNYNGTVRADESPTTLFASGQYMPNSCGATGYSVTINTKNATAANPAWVSGWIDWNKNGTFEISERALAQSTGSTLKLTWAGTPALAAGDNIGMRFRIARDRTGVEAASGVAASGEVEDHRITVANCDVTLTKTASPTTVDFNNRTITYTFTVKNTGTVPLRNVVVNDPNLSPTNIATIATLAASETKTYTRTLNISATRVAAGGQIPNTATLTAEYVGNGDSGELKVLTKTASATVNVDNTPKITVTKALDQNTKAAVGFPLQYTIVVTNDGNVPLTQVRVDDPALDAPAHLRNQPGVTTTILQPGEQAVFVGQHTVTQAEFDTSVFINTATASGQTSGGATVSGTSSAETPFEVKPRVLISKTGPTTTTDDTITYTFAVENTGNVSINSLYFNDPKLGVVNEQIYPNLFPNPPNPAKMAPGEIFQFTRTYNITQADKQAGFVDNSANVTGTVVHGVLLPANSQVVHTVIPANPALTLTKAVTVDHTGHVSTNTAVDSADDTLKYTFEVVNTGNLVIQSFTFTDALLGLNNVTPTLVAVGGPNDGNTVTQLQPGQRARFSYDYNVTQDDVDAAKPLKNTATITGTPVTDTPGVTPPTATSNTTTTTVLEAPAYEVEKALAAGESPTAERALNDSISYDITVRNSGNVSLSNMTYSDPLVGVYDAPFPAQPIAPGQSRTVTVTHVVGQADIDAGEVENSAVIRRGTIDQKTTNEVTVPTASESSIAVVKSGVHTAARPDGTAAAGDLVNYTITATNTGTTTLTNPKITDELLAITDARCVPAGQSATAPTWTLLPNEECVVTGTYTVKQADVNARTIENEASVTATDPSGNSLLADAATDVPLVGITGVSIEKTANPLTAASLTSKVPYTLTVKNTGTVTLTNVEVADVKYHPTNKLAVTPATLLPGETGTATFQYLPTQAERDAGRVDNHAFAEADVPAGYTPPTADDTNQVSVTGTSSLQVIKTYTQPVNISAAGQTVQYTLTVKNTGSVTVNNVVITDPKYHATNTLAVSPSSLAPGAEGTAQFTYTVTQQDIDSNRITNQASASGTPSDPAITLPPTQSNIVEVPTVGSPRLSIVKTLQPGAAPTKAGDIVTFLVEVTNSGYTTINNLTVADLPAGVSSVSVPKTTLAVGEKTSGTVQYVVKQADIDAGEFRNTATAQGQSANNAAVPPVTSNEVVVSFPANPSWTITKTSNAPTLTALGQTVNYTIVVKNTGNVTLNAVSVTDETGNLEVHLPFPLAPGASKTLTATQAVTQADIDAGNITNTAVADATPVRGEKPANLPKSTVTDPVTGTSAFTAVKTSDTTIGGIPTKTNDEVEFVFTVTNTGTTTLTNVLLSDPLLGITNEAVTLPGGVLLPGDNVIIRKTYAVTQADVDAKKVTNFATISVSPPTGQTVPDPQTPQVTQTINGVPDFSITKVGTAQGSNGLQAKGDKINYVITITNTGDVTLLNPKITDAKLGIIQAVPLRNGEPVTALAPQETAQITVVGQVTQAEVDGQEVTNTASAAVDVPTPYESQKPADKSASETLPVTGITDYTLNKSATPVKGEAITAAGQTIRYTIQISNTGTTTLSNLQVNDAFAGATPLNLYPSMLSPGATGTVSFDYAVTQADVDAGTLVNEAFGQGTALGNPIPEKSDTTTTQIQAEGGIKVVKSAVRSGGEGVLSAAGHVVEYTLAVTNTGNVTLNDVTVTDAKLGITDLVVGTGTLLPGETIEVVRTYVLTQDDVDAKEVENAASANATTPDGSPVSDAAQLETPIQSTSSFAVGKSALVNTADHKVTAAGQTITYTITVYNTGTTRLHGVEVSDPHMPAGTVTSTGIVSGSGKATTSPAVIEPGQSGNVSFDYVVLQSDLDDLSKEIVNVAQASAVTPDIPSGPTGTRLPEQDSNKVIVPTEAEGALAVEKFATGAPTKAGDIITYEFKVTNTGQLTLEVPDILDSLVSPTAIPVVLTDSAATQLPPGASATLSVPYTVTQADVDRGYVENQAVSKVVPINESDPLDPNPESNEVVVLIPRDNSFLVKKTGTPTSGQLVAAGDTIDYTITLTNTGNTTLTDPQIKDTKLDVEWTDLTDITPQGPGAQDLLPGAVATFTKRYTLTQEDVDQGQVTNTAQGRATTTSDTPEQLTPRDSNTVELPITGTTGLLVEKEVDLPDPNYPSAAGQTITYRMKVTNTGTRSINNLAVLDPLFDGRIIKLDQDQLAPQESTTTEDLQYTLTQEDVDNGSVVNTAYARGVPAGDTAATPDIPSNVVEVGLNGNPAFNFSKVQTSTAIPTKAGEKVTYALTVENTGQVSLLNVRITDDTSDQKFVVLDQPLLPGTSKSVDFTRTLTQADVDAGHYTNLATATGTPPDKNGVPQTPLPPKEATVTTPIVGTSSLGFVKDMNTNGDLTAAGHTVTYMLTVTNTGTITLNNPTVTDEKLSATPILMKQGTLQPGESVSRNFDYALTQADVDSGRAINNAHATATPTGETVTLPPVYSQVDKPITPTQRLEIVKSASVITPGGLHKQGDLIEYSFTVTNVGTATVVNPTVTDPVIGLSNAPLGIARLGVGEHATITRQYALTQDNVEAERIVNTATAQGTSPIDGNPIPVATSNEVTEPINAVTSFEVRKTGASKTGAALTRAGQVVTFTLGIENTGTTRLRNATVSDTMLGVQDAPVTPQSLLPGETGTATFDYTLTQADVDAGFVQNVATGEITPWTRTDPWPEKISPIVTVPIGGAPSLSVTKGVQPFGANDANSPGDTLTYWVDVTNNGSVTLSDVQVQDLKISPSWSAVPAGGSGGSGLGSLNPGETKRLTFTYTLTQADLDLGQVRNTAQAKGTPPNGAPEITNNSNEVVVGLNGKPGASLIKERITEKFPSKIGGIIEYKITVINTGQTTLKNFKIVDDGADEKSFTVAGPLAPGASHVVQATHTVTQADMDAGTFKNIAKLSGVLGEEITNNPESNPIDTPLSRNPQLEVKKAASTDGPLQGAGDIVTYTLTVTNTGNVTLQKPAVRDPLYGPDPYYVADSLKPGESAQWSFEYKVTQADVDAARVTNVASATATAPPGSPVVQTVESNEVITEIGQFSTLELVKESELIRASDGKVSIKYMLTLSNDGNTTLTDAMVSDPNLKVADHKTEPSTIGPGESGVAVFEYEVTEADIAKGQVENIASGQARQPSGQLTDEVESNRVVTDVTLPQTGSDLAGLGLLAMAALLSGGLLAGGRRKPILKR